MSNITIGIVGGLGPEGTVHYYRKLTTRLSEIPLAERPGIIVDHVWMDRFAGLLRSGATDEIAALLGDSVARLHRAGAGLAMIAAVTPHKFLADIQRSAPTPVVDLVAATERHVTAARCRTVGLLGTRPTLTEPFLRGALERAGIRVTVPDEDGISYLNELIFGPLASGTKTAEMGRRVRGIVLSMGAAAPLDAVVVACTDLMDLMDPTLRLIDPIDCHVSAAVASARGIAKR
jgi:aspartate racemase